ncbi:hypothetical protein BU15DRAFT_42482 [Melanogaster broomeanus]|nr:hypothetical protein BU15DRAFT_42482 [Melanogaster broomeanus]
MILQFEEFAKDDKELVHARILGYLIIHGPSDEARKTVAREVNSCDGDETRLGKLGQFYVEHYIRGCGLMQFFVRVTLSLMHLRLTVKKYKGQTPTRSNQSSRLSFDTITAPTQHQAAKRKVSTYMLIIYGPDNGGVFERPCNRDNFCCVITGVLDVDSALHDPELRQMGQLVAVTHCAHIFPQSTNMNISGDEDSISMSSCFFDEIYGW